MNQLFKNTTTMKISESQRFKALIKIEFKKYIYKKCIEVHMQGTMTVSCLKEYKTERI